MPDQLSRPGSEVESLRRELASARKRLEDEVGYYRGQLESSRKRVETEHLRVQAAEVAKRRNLENEVTGLQVRLRDSEQQCERLQLRYDELSDQYLHQEAAGRESVEAQVNEFKAAATAAWRSAEEELARMEQELASTSDALAHAQQRCEEMEATLRSLQGMDGDVRGDLQQEAVEELAALKQALNLSERARIQTQRRSVRMAEKIVELQLEYKELELSSLQAASKHDAGATQKPRGFAHGLSGSANPTEIDLSRANAVLREVSMEVAADDQGTDKAGRSSSGDLAIEFMLTSSDQSLDRRKLAQLKEQVEQEELLESNRKLEAQQAAREKELMRMADEDNLIALASAAAQQVNSPPGKAPRSRMEREPASQSPVTLVRVLLAAAVVSLLGVSAWFLR